MQYRIQSRRPPGRIVCGRVEKKAVGSVKDVGGDVNCQPGPVVQ